MKVSVLLVSAVVVFVHFVHCQDNNIPGARRITFNLDRYSDCDGRLREVETSKVFINGNGTEVQAQHVTCNITLHTEHRAPHIFKLQILEVRIDDPSVYFYIYDGEYQGKLLRAFNITNNKPPNLKVMTLFTSGQLVTFRMTREEEDRSYDIRVVAEPIPSDLETLG